MKQSEIKAELSASSARYYAPVLEKAGFISRKADQLNWYRMKGDVLQHIHVCLPGASAPACVYFIFGAHSLFHWAEPDPGLFTSAASYCGIAPPIMETYHFGKRFAPLNGSSPIYYAVDCPRRGGGCLEEEIVPLLDRLDGAEQAYQYHIQRERQAAEALGEVGSNLRNFQFFEPRFLDEILFFRDETAYEYVRHYLKYMSERCERDPDRDARLIKRCKTSVAQKRLLLGDGMHTREHLNLLQNALTQADWAPFDKVMRQRTALNSVELQKKLPELHVGASFNQEAGQ